MIYINKNGSEDRPGKFKIGHAPKIVRRHVSFALLDRGSYATDKFVKIVWKHAGCLCVSVQLVGTYRAPDGTLKHNYDLRFQTGPKLIDERGVNEIVAAIEDEAQAELNVDCQGHTHRPPTKPNLNHPEMLEL